MNKYHEKILKIQFLNTTSIYTNKKGQFPINRITKEQLKQIKEKLFEDGDFPSERIVKSTGEQSEERANYFEQLGESKEDYNSKIIAYARAIDYDILNPERYNKLIKLYKLIIENDDDDITMAFNRKMKNDLRTLKARLSSIQSAIDKTCKMPVLYDLTAKKRADTSSWVLDNKREFVDFMKTQFKNDVTEEERKPQYIWDAAKNELKKGEIYSHQKFISSFIQENSPYRGVLLYYGLGSGKTLGSINIAEGFDREVVILLPASLEPNYLNDLYNKGNTMYHKENHWCFYYCNDRHNEEEKGKLKEIGFPVENDNLMKKLFKERENGTSGFWVIDHSDPTNNNFNDFSEKEQTEIQDTVNTLIKHKYKIFHTNGGMNIVSKILSEINPEYKVLINNLIREIVPAESLNPNLEIYRFRDLKTDTLRKQIKEEIMKRIIDPKNRHYTNPFDNKVIIIDEVHNFISTVCNRSSNGVFIYELLLRSNNCRIVALSGTPIINSPFEVSILFNLLKGLIRYHKFTIMTDDRVLDEAHIGEILSANKHIDRYHIDAVNKTIEVTQIPDGFIKDPENKNRVTKSDEAVDYKDFISEIIENLRGHRIQLSEEGIQSELFTIFPDIFRKTNIEKPFLLSVEEAKDDFYSLYVDKANNDLKHDHEFKVRSMGVVSFYNEINNHKEKLFPDKIQGDPEYVPVSDYQLILYHAAREIERQQEKSDKGKSNVANIVHNIESKVTSTFKVGSRQKLLFVFPKELKRKTNKEIKEDIEKFVAIKEAEAQDFDEQVDLKVLKLQDVKAQFERDIINLLTQEHLTVNDSPMALQHLSPKYARILENINETPGLVLGYSEFRSVEGIEIFSRVLEANGYERYNPDNDAEYDIQTPLEIGHKVRYEESENVWRTAEVLEVGEEMVKLVIEGEEAFERPISEVYRCRFALWTGTEDVEQREITMNRYRNSNNMFGQEILILLITSSGAEGINLKYVRQVHLMEPYWNKVRTDQVIGRARRIKSHSELPEDQRNVRVYEYVSRFTPEQLEGTWGEKMNFNDLIAELNDDQEDEEATKRSRAHQMIEMFKKRISNSLVKADRKVTSDEILMEISNKKFVIISKFLGLLKAASVDCFYNKEHNILSDEANEKIQCLDRITGIGADAFDPKGKVEKRDDDIYQKKVEKAIHVLPYRTKEGQIIKLLYELDEDVDLEDLSSYAPLYSYYTYFGINPILKHNQKGTKHLIGSITRDAQTQKLRLVLDKNFVKIIPIFARLESIIRNPENPDDEDTEESMEVPSFSNERDLILFIKHLQDNPHYIELQSAIQLNEEEEPEEAPVKKTRKIKLNIKQD